MHGKRKKKRQEKSRRREWIETVTAAATASLIADLIKALILWFMHKQ